MFRARTRGRRILGRCSKQNIINFLVTELAEGLRVDSTKLIDDFRWVRGLKVVHATEFLGVLALNLDESKGRRCGVADGHVLWHDDGPG